MKAPDLRILETLVEGENLILSDPGQWVPLVFDGRPVEEIEQLIAFYRHGTDETVPMKERFRVAKYLGYPRAGAQLPCYAVRIGSSEESTKGIGNLLAERDEQGYRLYGSLFSGRIEIAVHAHDPNLVSLLSMAVQHILLSQRVALDREGFHKQSISLGDIEPPAEDQPTFGFVRVVNWHAEYAQSWVMLVSTVKTIQIEGSYLDPTGEPYGGAAVVGQAGGEE